jgi:hypothetical protein
MAIGQRLQRGVCIIYISEEISWQKVRKICEAYSLSLSLKLKAKAMII